MHICVNRRGPHNWHSSNPAAVILLVCGRCTDPASSQRLVCGTARPIPGISRFGATNKPHRVSKQGESATNKRDIWQSPSMCFLHCLRFCQKQRRRRHCRCQERRPHRITTWENRGRTSAKQQFHNEKRMPFHLAIRIRSMPSATFHRGWRK